MAGCAPIGAVRSVLAGDRRCRVLHATQGFPSSRRKRARRPAFSPQAAARARTSGHRRLWTWMVDLDLHRLVRAALRPAMLVGRNDVRVGHAVPKRRGPRSSFMAGSRVARPIDEPIPERLAADADVAAAIVFQPRLRPTRDRPRQDHVTPETAHQAGTGARQTFAAR
jgi:hypothetical protein